MRRQSICYDGEFIGIIIYLNSHPYSMPLSIVYNNSTELLDYFYYLNYYKSSRGIHKLKLT